MLSSARTFSKQVLNHRTQIQQQTKSQLRNQQHNGPGRGAKDQQQTSRQSNNNNNTAEDDNVHRQSAMLDKIRLENRERKKRWRLMNEDRNKDNDLRCRVNKRANKLFGSQSTPEKEEYIVEEFQRRQSKRKDKEMKKRESSLEKEVEELDAVVATAKKRKANKLDEPAIATTSRLPQSFGSYSALPPHQVRAANSFWKSVAAQQALNVSSLVKNNSSSSSNMTVDDKEGQEALPLSNNVVQLPPLSSVVPEQYLSQGKISTSPSPTDAENPSPTTVISNSVIPVSNAAPHVPTPTTRLNTDISEFSLAATASSSSSSSSDIAYYQHQQRDPVVLSPTLSSRSHKHVRPWEDDMDYRHHHHSTPYSGMAELSPSSDYYELNDDRLSEAAFSLMTLSNTNHHPPPSPLS